MTSAVVILSVLFFTSAILCVTMTLAWVHFGRRPHASSWAFAYGLGALQWVVNALGVLAMPGNVAPIIVASVLVLASGALVAIGARQRAGLPLHIGVFVSAGLVFSVAIVLVYTVYPHRALQGALSNIFAGGAVLVAAISTWPRGCRPNAPEWAFIVMMVIFALYQAGLSAAAFDLGAAGDAAALERYRAILGIGLPPVYVGAGIAAVFLMAGDLSESMGQLVTRDGLTGALNRRGVQQAAMVAMANARRRAAPLTVVIGDIDHFKQINDRFGHAAGDAALVAFADTVQAAVREEDIVGRLGGDEFCLLLADVTPAGALSAVERIRMELEAMPVAGRPDLTLRASFGVAGFRPEDLSFGAVLHRADGALYKAKNAGRNRTIIAA